MPYVEAHMGPQARPDSVAELYKYGRGAGQSRWPDTSEACSPRDAWRWRLTCPSASNTVVGTVPCSTRPGGMTSTWAATTSQGRMVGDYISTSYDSNNLAHGVFGLALQPSSGTACTTSALDNCNAPIATFASGLASGALSSAADRVLYTGNGGAGARSLWNVVDNNGSKHRD